jgi:hypothetical protein
MVTRGCTVVRAPDRYGPGPAEKPRPVPFG